MAYCKTLAVLFLSATASILGGCVTDASQCGIPAPSWYTACNDGTVVPRSGSSRLTDPNVYNNGQPLWWICDESPDRSMASSVGPYDNLNEPWGVKSNKPEKDCCKDGGSCCTDGGSCCTDGGSCCPGSSACTQPCCDEKK